MKKKLAFLFLFLIIAGLSFSFASAQEFTAKDPGWQGIVPCGRNSGANGETQICTLCHLVLGIQRIVQYGLYIVIAFAFAGIFIAGVMYVISSGSEGMITQAKGFLSASLIGFAVVLGAWIIVNTTLWIIGSNKYDPGNGLVAETWWRFSCSTTNAPRTTTPAPATSGRQICEDVGGTCGYCPMVYEVKDAVCAGNQLCCKGYANTKPYCEAWGGKCRMSTGVLAGCKSGETEDKERKYNCGDLNMCCFGPGGPVAPKPVEKCEDKGGTCMASASGLTTGGCPMTYQKNYLCSSGVCCVGWDSGTSNQVSVPSSCGNNNKGTCNKGVISCPGGYSWLGGGKNCPVNYRCCVKNSNSGEICGPDGIGTCKPQSISCVQPGSSSNYPQCASGLKCCKP